MKESTYGLDDWFVMNSPTQNQITLTCKIIKRNYIDINNINFGMICSTVFCEQSSQGRCDKMFYIMYYKHKRGGDDFQTI